MTDDLAARIRRLEDIEEIRRLKWRYCNWSDRGWAAAGTDYPGWAELFVEDAIYETQGLTPSFTDRAALDRWNVELGTTTRSFSFHIIGSGEIEVDGDIGHGHWHGLTPVTDPEGRTAVWSAGVFDDEFRRTPGGWRFAAVRFRSAFIVPYDGAGWVRSPD